MLGLATHEPNFTIIREEFKPNKPRPCALCGQMGHEIKDCQGTAREKQGEVSLKVVVVWCVADSVRTENFVPGCSLNVSHMFADHLTRITMSHVMLTMLCHVVVSAVSRLRKSQTVDKKQTFLIEDI